MNSPAIVKSFNAGGSIGAYCIVKAGANKLSVVQAAGATDAILGVNGAIPVNQNEPVDIVLTGVTPVKAGGNITFGDLLTSDANANAIATTTANNRTIGIAMDSAVSGDIIPVLLIQSAI